MMKDDLISKSALLNDLRKQVPYVKNITRIMEIVERQSPASNVVEYEEVVKSKNPDKEHLINTIVYILMTIITMLVSAFILSKK